MVKNAPKYWSVLLLLIMGGCASGPTGPNVMVLPSPGKPFEVFRGEDADCRQWAALQIGEEPHERANRGTASGAVLGSAIGAGAGAALGAISGNAGTGAAIGGGSGLLFGSAAGSSTGREYASDAQQKYDITYMQCMYAKGNQIPGVVSRGVRKDGSTPPPPSQKSQPPANVPEKR